MDLISIIVPCYNEAEALPFFFEEFEKLRKAMDYVKFEVLLINDGSKDDTFQVMKDLAEKSGGGRLHILFP